MPCTRRTISDALDFQLRGEAFGYANDEVVHERAAQAPHGACILHFLARRDDDAAVFLETLTAGTSVTLSSPFGPLTFHGLTFDRGG